MQPFFNLANALTESHDIVPEDLERTISSLASRTVLIAAISLAILVVIAALATNRFPKLKVPVFVLMATAMLGSVLILLGSTIYLNTKSESGGPIHWHADFEIWACGNELELRDPTGTFSNKIGTAVLHEHNDQRIHLEGVVVKKSHDASLGKFFDVIGGSIEQNELVVPLNKSTDLWLENSIDHDKVSGTPGILTQFISEHGQDDWLAEFKSGQKCGEDIAEVQVFVYKFDEDKNVYWQEKIVDPSQHVIFESPNVPPGNCIMIEFEPFKERTNRLCKQYGIRDIDRCEDFGVEADKRAICKAREVGGLTESGEIIELEDLHDFTPDEIRPLEVEGEG